jgi:hypothetical protein
VPENQNYLTFHGSLLCQSSTKYVGQFMRKVEKSIIALSKLGCGMDQ